MAPPRKLETARIAVQLDVEMNHSLPEGSWTVNSGFKPQTFHSYSLLLTVLGPYPMMLIARATIVVPMTTEMADCAIISTLHQRESGSTSAGANEAALVKAR